MRPPDLAALVVEATRYARAPGDLTARALARLGAAGIAAPPSVPRVTLTADAATGTADLELFGPIGGWFGKNAQEVVDEIRALQNVTTLRVHINSLGGDVFEGFAIYNSLREFPGRVETIIKGVAASIASVIALAGKDGVTVMAPAMVMIHDPRALAYGGSDDMRAMAKLLDKAANVIADVYTARTKQPKATVRAWMAEETWFEPEEAKAEGFVDTVIAPTAAPEPHPAPAASAAPAASTSEPPRRPWVRELAARELEIFELTCAGPTPRPGKD